MLARGISRFARANESVRRSMCSSAVIHTLKVTIPTRSSKPVEYEMPYIRTNPRGTTRIVAVHGSPGSLEDYRCLIGPLQRRIPDMDFIAMTLPDVNFTFKTEAFWHSAEEKKELIVKFLRSIHVNDIDILVGHSAGVYPALLTALYSPFEVKSVATMCGTGTKIIPFLQPEWLHTKLLLPLIRNAWTRTAGLAACKFLMNRTGFSKMSGIDAFASLQSQHATRYWEEHNAPRWLRDLTGKDLPRLLIYAGRDKLMSPDRSIQLSKEWGSPNTDSHFIYGGTSEKSAQVLQKGDAEARCPVVAFPDAGHFVFMQFPEIVAEHIARLKKFTG